MLLGTIGVALGAAAGLSMRLTQSEHKLLGPFSDTFRENAARKLKARMEDAAAVVDRLGDGLVTPAEPRARDDAADWETVLGGGPPQNTASTP